MSCCQAGLCKVFGKSLPRGFKNVKEQSRPLGAGNFTPGIDENGKPINVFHGASHTCNVPLLEPEQGQKRVDEKGLLVSLSGLTLYDTLMNTKFESRPCFRRCTKPHVFKDAIVDGKPNPKPMIISTPGIWEDMTYAQARQTARAFGSCLRYKYGLKKREKISIWSGNSPEWMLADLACVAYNWTSVSVYDTLGPNAASYIVADSGAKVLVCEPKTFEKVPDLLKDETYSSNPGKALSIVIVIGEAGAQTKQALQSKGLKVATFAECVNEFKDKIVPDTPPEPNSVGTLMYTSGTTGNPKGVMLTHKNLVSTIAAVCMCPKVSLRASDVHLSYLPLAHIFERAIQFGLLQHGASIAFASNGAKALLPDLGVIRPTLFAGVPKVYENIRDAVARKMTGFKKKLFERALAAKIADIETGCGYCPIWDLLIFNKTKQALGGRVRYCISGGAPISKDTLQFVMCALGPIVQGYGATETSAAATLSQMGDMTLGHVGPPMPHTTVQLIDVPEMNYFAGEPADYPAGSPGALAFAAGKAKRGGEIWIRGHGVSPGYYDPSCNGLVSTASNGMKKKTNEEFCIVDGLQCFKTGDIGMWTDQGCVRVVDRRKNMFKTSLGEYVPVEEVEKTYQDTCGFVDFVFLPKETKVSYVALVCVISDSIGTVMKWAKTVPELAGKEAEAVCDSPQFKAMLLAEFKAAAKKKKLLPFLQVQKVENLHTEFQPPGYQEKWVEGVKCPNGHVEQLLTATFKARRAQLDQYYAPVFKKIYPDRPRDHILP
eukprot:TRINITY_DN6313_c0_g3_i4.p1 TRINITY_DN6313_c0_g3~~TRINITY_DN6313_c0_g3_i4.p1  ORF type:complete len:772 (+),score=127.34 TRINITY_DN6313_c0_g3_i4:55-2370(+)